MIDLIFSGYLMFKGAGPGAADGFNFQVLPAHGGEVVSFRLPSGSDLHFLRAGNSGASLVGVQGFDGADQRLVEYALDSNEVHGIGRPESGAIFYPTLSANGKWVSGLLAPGRFDMPPRSFKEASLVVFPVLHHDKQPATLPAFSGFQEIAKNLPIVPVDWSSDGARIFYVTVDGGKEHIEAFNFSSNTRTLVAEGVLPRASADGRWLAAVQKKNVVILDAKTYKVLRTIPTGWPIGWLAWHPEGTALAISESGPVYRSRISIIDPASGKKHPLLETGSVADLCWVGSQPKWPRYQRR